MNENTIILKLLEHDDRFTQIEEKMASDKRDLMDTLDKILFIVQRMDQERVFTNAHLKRHDEDITRIKVHVGLPV